MAENETTANAETGTGAAAERTYKSVNGKEVPSANGELPKGKLSFVRPAKLAEEGITGVVAEGIYEGTIENKFDANKPDYKVRAENGDLTILNSAGSLASQLSRTNVGEYVQIIYKGMVEMTKGKMAGKKSHSFVVLIAD